MAIRDNATLTTLPKWSSKIYIFRIYSNCHVRTKITQAQLLPPTFTFGFAWDTEEQTTVGQVLRLNFRCSIRLCKSYLRWMLLCVRKGYSYCNVTEGIGSIGLYIHMAQLPIRYRRFETNEMEITKRRKREYGFLTS